VPDSMDALRNLLAGATFNVGEWVTEGQSGWSDGWTKIKGSPDAGTLGHARLADAALIVAAVNALPLLLDVVEAAYVLKHEGRAEPLHDALYRLEREEALHV
jgi:hypothetical protein